MPHPGPVYEIRICGHFAPKWHALFQPMAVVPLEDGVTLLRGEIRDQAALHGVLRRLEASGITLLSLGQLAEAPDRHDGTISATTRDAHR